ncbi:hypothetical protein Y1Q_0001325 [Alligator mississippiensis]|uniref:Uncharacterized protein n=1 Tax=Alligator mississippiensis TaxID=8496 RepID=A0A151M917_ALLMI|nr:hypothetical protein Y1Q_0001325 [Alligator mississippiensis]
MKSPLRPNSLVLSWWKKHLSYQAYEEDALLPLQKKRHGAAEIIHAECNSTCYENELIVTPTTRDFCRRRREAAEDGDLSNLGIYGPYLSCRRRTAPRAIGAGVMEGLVEAGAAGLCPELVLLVGTSAFHHSVGRGKKQLGDPE